MRRPVIPLRGVAGRPSRAPKAADSAEAKIGSLHRNFWGSAVAPSSVACVAAGVGALVRSTTGAWIVLAPQHCPNGHRLGLGETLVGHQALPRARRRAHHMDMPHLR
jgi:hypothetical protein